MAQGIGRDRISLREENMSRKCYSYVTVLLLSLLLSLSACSSKQDDAQSLASVLDPDAIGQEESLESQAIDRKSVV